MVGRTSLAVASVAVCVGCAPTDVREGGSGRSNSASVDFSFEVPPGASIQTVELELECADYQEAIVVNVIEGTATARVGGVTPGTCTATMTASTPEGVSCFNAELFEVTAAGETDVWVTLLCQGENDSSAELPACYGDLIDDVYATQTSVELGQGTAIEVVMYDSPALAQATYSFTVRQRDSDARGFLESAPLCDPGSSVCRRFSCSELGSAAAVDPETNLRTSEAWVSVTVTGEECFDTSALRVECVRPAECGDGVVEGAEECDDANDDPADGCDECSCDECSVSETDAGL